jgi:DUF3040 family protein
VALMSLNAHDKHALDKIEERLADTDPRFAARLSAFSRLADGSTMPERERIRPGPKRTFGRSGRLAWATVAGWLVISLGLIAVALIASHTDGGCKQGQAASCASRDANPALPNLRDYSHARVP